MNREDRAALAQYVFNAFHWRRTDEGHEFWKEAFAKLLLGDTPNHPIDINASTFPFSTGDVRVEDYISFATEIRIIKSPRRGKDETISRHRRVHRNP